MIQYRISPKPPELITGEGLSSQSTIAAIMEGPRGVEIVQRYLPSFTDNAQAKQAYGLNFKTLAPMLELPENVLNALLAELDRL